MPDHQYRDERVPNSIPPVQPEVRIPAPPTDEVTHPAQISAVTPLLPIPTLNVSRVLDGNVQAPTDRREVASSAAGSPNLPMSLREVPLVSAKPGPIEAGPEVRINPLPLANNSPAVSETDLDQVASDYISKRASKWQLEFDRVKATAFGLQKRGMTVSEVHDYLVRTFRTKLPYKQLCNFMPTKGKRNSRASS